MNIALDYDNTYTADPRLWSFFIVKAKALGHKIFIVTLRSEEEDRDDDTDFLNDYYGVPFVWCNGVAKKQVVEKMGIKIDIWIDDMPDTITYGSAYSLEELEEWRNTRHEVSAQSGDCGGRH